MDAKETMTIASTISNNIPDKRPKIKATGREKDVKNIYITKKSIFEFVGLDLV